MCNVVLVLDRVVDCFSLSSNASLPSLSKHSDSLLCYTCLSWLLRRAGVRLVPPGIPTHPPENKTVVG